MIPYRDLDEACDLTASAAQQLFDFRTGSNIQRNMKVLLRQSVYSRPVGRPSNKPKQFYHSFDYQAKSWDRPRRVAGNFLRRIALPKSVKYWTLTTLREKLIKIGAKMVRHARYVTFQLAEVAIPRWLYQTILNRIRRFAATLPRAAPI